MGALFSELVSDRPGTAALAALLLLAGNITEGFSLLALIPLLHASGFGDGETGGAVHGALVSSLERIGVGLTLPVALGLFVGLVGVRAAAAWQRDAVFERARLGAVDRLRERLHRAMSAASWRFLASRGEADLRHVLTGEVRRVGAAFGHLLHVTVALTVAATHLAVAFVISPPTAGAILVAIVALYCLTRPLLRRSETLGGEITDANRVIYAQVQDFLAGLKFAKSHAAERAHVAHLSAAVTALRERCLASATVAALARAAIQFGAAVVLAAAGWFVLVETGLPLPTLVVVVVLSARTMTMLGGVQWRAHDLANTLPAFLHARSALADLTAAAEEGPEERPRAPSSRTVRRDGSPPPGGRRGEGARMVLSERLGVRGVSFDYLRDFGAAAGGAGGAGGGALREIDLDIRRGEFLVLSGPSGAGKTTLADLLVGLMPPTTGRIWVDGVALDGGNRRRWRASCALLAARPYLFPGRIRANLAWGREDADEEEMRRALEAAAADFVFRLGKGWTRRSGTGAPDSPPASASGSPSRGRCSAGRPCWRSTKRPANSTRPTRAGCWRPSVRSAARRRSWRPPTAPRSSPPPTGWSGSSRAGSSPRGPPGGGPPPRFGPAPGPRRPDRDESGPDAARGRRARPDRRGRPPGHAVAAAGRRSRVCRLVLVGSDRRRRLVAARPGDDPAR